MEAYIQGAGLISPQQTADPMHFLQDVIPVTGNFLTCIDPPYREYIHPIASRRMSRLIKMGITAAKMALKDAGYAPDLLPENESLTIPDAIITGTGLGSVEDTEKILTEMVSGQPLMNPTPFIQSTYNTISSQIAIALKCHQYNSTYVHRSFSFESALQDALLLLRDGDARTALVGGIDEMTLNHWRITLRTGHWKKEPVCNLNLLQYETPGALAGEGSAYFLLGEARGKKSCGRIRSIKTLYRPGTADDIRGQIHQFLAEQTTRVQDVDGVMLGLNGDIRFDGIYKEIAGTIFSGTPQLWYKHLCGEYYTSSGFALWLAANILKNQEIPSVIRYNHLSPEKLQNILLYNQYRNIHHSLILITAD